MDIQTQDHLDHRLLTDVREDTNSSVDEIQAFDLVGAPNKSITTFELNQPTLQRDNEVVLLKRPRTEHHEFEETVNWNNVNLLLPVLITTGAMCNLPVDATTTGAIYDMVNGSLVDTLAEATTNIESNKPESAAPLHTQDDPGLARLAHQTELIKGCRCTYAPTIGNPEEVIILEVHLDDPSESYYTIQRASRSTPRQTTAAHLTLLPSIAPVELEWFSPTIVCGMTVLPDSQDCLILQPESGIYLYNDRSAQFETTQCVPQNPENPRSPTTSIWKARRRTLNEVTDVSRFWSSAVECFLHHRRRNPEAWIVESGSANFRTPKLTNPDNSCWINAVLQIALSMLACLQEEPIKLELGDTQLGYELFLSGFQELRVEHVNKAALMDKLTTNGFLAGFEVGRQEDASMFWAVLSGCGPLSKPSDESAH